MMTSETIKQFMEIAKGIQEDTRQILKDDFNKDLHIEALESEVARLQEAFVVIAKGWHSPAISYSRHILMGKSIEEAKSLGWVEWEEVESYLS